MKVTHIIIGLDVGGAELALKNIVEYSKKNGIFENKVISLTDVGVVGKKLQGLGIEVTALTMRGLLDVPRVIWQLTNLLKQQKPQIVQSWMYHADLFGGIAARFAGIKNIFWGIRCTDILAGKGVSYSTYFIMKACALLSYFIPHTIICVANAAKMTHSRFGYCSKKIQVVPNGIDVTGYERDDLQRKEIRSKFSIPDDAIVIGSVGRFNEYKDHRNFIKAAAKLARVNNNLVFLMVGKDITSENSQLMQWINDTGFTERFILLGERSDINLCYQAMDIFCLHSRSEGFPNVVAEAMCSGVPCVVTDVGDSSVIIGPYGKVVVPENHQALADGLQEIIGISTEERVQIGEGSRKYIFDNYSLAAAVHNYATLYKQVL